MFRMLLLFLFSSLYVNFLFSQKTVIYIENNTKNKLQFLDYLTLDSIYYTSKRIDSFLIDNNEYNKTIIVNNERFPKKFNSIILNTDTINVNCSNYILEFKDNITNFKHQKMVQSLDSLKKINSPEELKNKLVYNFMYHNADLILSLHYLYNTLLYNTHSKDSALLLSQKIAPKLKNHKLWKKCENLFLDVKILKEGDVFPRYSVINTNLKKTKLYPFRKKTLLIFWASWCKACIQEIEAIKINKKYFLEYDILLINIDKKTDVWKENLKKYSLTNYENYNLENSFENKMAIELYVKSIPKNVIINNKNIIENINARPFNIDSLVYNLYYESNIYKLNIVQKEKIQKIIKANSNKLITSVKVTGFADAVGKELANLKLSERRAKGIESYLKIENNSFNIKSLAKGEVETEKEVGEQKNRRVELKLYYLSPKTTITNNLREIEIGEKLILENILFEGNKAIILPNSHPEIRKLKEYLKKNPSYCIEIQGHINGGSLKWNGDFPILLSTKRAKVVQDFLIKNHIRPNRLSYKGYGEKFPIAFGDKSYKNRRVEILRVNCTNRIDSNLAVTLYFEEKSTQLVNYSGEKISSLMKLLNENPKSKIKIIGFACCNHYEGKNNIYTKRAKFIYDYLVKKGVNANRISYKGIRPDIESSNDKTHFLNRKVEVYIIKSK